MIFFRLKRVKARKLCLFPKKLECLRLITVGISESDAKIKQLAGHFFHQHGYRCSSSVKQTDKDFIFCTPKSNALYDVFIENTTPQVRARADYIHLFNSDEVFSVPASGHSLFITYGLNRFATVTSSSMHEEEGSLQFQYCLQRSIVSLKGKIIECQEFPVDIYGDTVDIHSALAFATLSLIAGINPTALARVVLPKK